MVVYYKGPEDTVLHLLSYVPGIAVLVSGISLDINLLVRPCKPDCDLLGGGQAVQTMINPDQLARSGLIDAKNIRTAAAASNIDVRDGRSIAAIHIDMESQGQKLQKQMVLAQRNINAICLIAAAYPFPGDILSEICLFYGALRSKHLALFI